MEENLSPRKQAAVFKNLVRKKIKITSKGIDAVEEHISRFDQDVANQNMIKRLRDIQDGKIEATQTDLNFYSHELRESVRYRKLGWPSGQPNEPSKAYDLWNNAHTAALEDYSLKEGSGVLYHPSAIGGK